MPGSRLQAPWAHLSPRRANMQAVRLERLGLRSSSRVPCLSFPLGSQEGFTCYSRKKVLRVLMIRDMALPEPLSFPPARSPLPGEAEAAPEHPPSPLLCSAQD